MPGCLLELEMLYPSAMSPLRSIATLPIQRYAESGAYVPCWYTVGIPFGLRSSYQRTPTELPTVTLWLTTSDSWSPKLRYASRYIRRSASESSCVVVPLCGMHVPPPLQAAENAATGIVIGPVNVVFAVFVQSTWNRHSSRLFVPKARTSFGEPAGGGVAPWGCGGRGPADAGVGFKHCCL